MMSSLAARMPLLVEIAVCSVAIGACGDDDRGVLIDGGADPGDGGSAVDGAVPGDGGCQECSGPHPFGTHGGYTAGGVIFPAASQAARDAATAAFYDAWKARYLEPACQDGHYRVDTSSDTGAHTVSEGHGYGMLVTVIMAGHDPDARSLFDGLYAYFDDHRSGVDPSLMAWAQNEGCANVDGDASATDGDLDIGYALLLADRQWGSDGAIDYRGAALDVIGGILASEIHPDADSVLIGDWADDGDEHHTGTRLSDQMPGHFKAFGAAAGVARWDDVVDRAYATIGHLQAEYAADTGLLPDFAVGATGATPAPAPDGWLEQPTDDAYAWNACRAPWRIATDYLMSGDARSRDAARRITAWFRATTGDDPGELRAGYELDGAPLAGYGSMAFTAPLAVAAMIEPAAGTNGPWLDALWGELVASEPEGYYADSIKLLSMIVVSGNWWD